MLADCFYLVDHNLVISCCQHDEEELLSHADDNTDDQRCLLTADNTDEEQHLLPHPADNLDAHLPKKVLSSEITQQLAAVLDTDGFTEIHLDDGDLNGTDNTQRSGTTPCNVSTECAKMKTVIGFMSNTMVSRSPVDIVGSLSSINEILEQDVGENSNGVSDHDNTYQHERKRITAAENLIQSIENTTTSNGDQSTDNVNQNTNYIVP